VRGHSADPEMAIKSDADFNDNTLKECGTREHAVNPIGHLRRELSSFGVIILTLSCISPVFSIFGVGADILQHAGTGAAGLFLFGIGAAVVWAVVYAELGSAYPYAGGDQPCVY
jgi:hypothetical protein